MAARLGRYEVLKHLASGGMADVLLGRTDGIEGFERHVVLKRIKPVHAQDLRFIRMFLDEARVAANLHHQHIVQVHDIGESEGEYFIAMEYLHGEDVRTIFQTASRSRHHVPLGYAMAIVSAAAAGLHYAHERRGPDKQPLGIVHRDISPSNILVGYDGSIKVVDFGIAKASARQESRTGALKGKVSYMSPEQCRSAEIDRRSDVYSLGVVLYELATTSRLFKGTNDYLVMDQIVNGRVPPPRSRRPDLPNELSAIILRAIAPDPERRYATAEELRRAIDQVADKLGLMASSSAIAAYMRQQFGEKPEPWLDLGGQVLAPLDGVGSAGLRSGGGWTELWRADVAPLGSGPVARASGAIGTGVGDNTPRAAPEPRDEPRDEPPDEPLEEPRTTVSAPLFIDEPPEPRAPRAERRPSAPRVERRPSTPSISAGMSWDRRSTVRVVSATRSAKIAAVIGSPLIVAIGVWIWWFAASDELPLRGGVVQPVATIPPIEEVAKLAIPAMSETEPEPESSAVPPARESISQATSRAHSPEIYTGATAKRAGRASALKVAEPAEPGRAPADEPPGRGPPAVAGDAAVAARAYPTLSPPGPPAAPASAAEAPAASSAAGSPPVPVVPGPPRVVDAPPALLSHALVERIAAGHSRELSRCDGGEELRGEVTVRFWVDAAGKVTKAQLATTLRKPGVAACILRAVQTWQFPPQGDAGALGTYTLSFQ